MVPCENPTSASWRLVEAVARKLVVQKRVEQRRGRLHAAQQRLGTPVLQGEPLVAERRHVAGLGPVRRDERGMRQELRQRRRQADQVVAVGADAVQQDDELSCGAASRRDTRPGKPAHFYSCDHKCGKSTPRPCQARDPR